jgi:hypothetical protein
MNNFISVNHQGGVCNTLFKFSAAISLALDNEVNYIFSNEFLRPIHPNCPKPGYDPDYSVYKDNLLRNIKFTEKLPQPYRVHNEPINFSYSPIFYNKGENLLLHGYFQSEKYFINNKEFILDLFRPTEQIKQAIFERIPKIESSISIHIRRGDYLNTPEYHPQQSLEYYVSAINLFGTDKNYLVFSDDLDGIKNIFDFLPNKQYISLGKDYLDLYAMSLCEHNIISNSTFGWWGAYLNENKNKKIVGPTNWFGPAANHLNSSDIIPNDWIKI